MWFGGVGVDVNVSCGGGVGVEPSCCKEELKYRVDPPPVVKVRSGLGGQGEYVGEGG